ncbi:MAG: hypothetical protein AB7S26_38055 [Sandaracinaceae bacterium]
MLELIPRTNFDFTFLGSGSQTRVLVGKIPTAQWTSGTLIVRVHSVQMATDNSITVKLVLDASTPEDPMNPFVSSDAITGADIDIDDQINTPTFIPSAITGDLGYMAALILSGNYGGSSGACQAELSVVLVMKAS